MKLEFYKIASISEANYGDDLECNKNNLKSTHNREQISASFFLEINDFFSNCCPIF
jgi:hypothetical protein